MKYVFLQIIVVVRFTGILCNGGEHHGDHGDHHHHGGGVPATEELTDLIQNFGLAVLGKDQESASDVQPTADHSHINVKVRPGQVRASESVQEGASCCHFRGVDEKNFYKPRRK